MKHLVSAAVVTLLCLPPALTSASPAGRAVGPKRTAPKDGRGYSGRVRAAVLLPDQEVPLALPWCADAPAERQVHWRPWGGRGDGGGQVGGERSGRGRGGLRAPKEPGIWSLELAAGDHRHTLEDLALITRVPFAEKRRGRINGYHIGRYPTEGQRRRDLYAPPKGFIEVKQEDVDVRVSEHFRLGDFLTKDQRNVWPKYLVLRMPLVDKLELVIDELQAMGVPVEHMKVMSGYRTPQYNGPGGKGRSGISRHLWGDAADVFVDNDGDGNMDDLNGDGWIDLQDARVILEAVDRVERAYPALVGGTGVYNANRHHGPFIHIDTRGRRARWGKPLRQSARVRSATATR